MGNKKLIDKALSYSPINNLIHIGAHEAQEIWLYDQYDFKKIYLVEPLPHCVEIIKDKISDTPKYQLFNCALGSTDGTSQIFIADGYDSGSSSLLEPRDSDISFSTCVDINVRKFSSLEIGDVDVAVIDTQGFEIEVLKGFDEKIFDINFAIVEFANYEGYIKQPTYKELRKFMKKKGFIIVDQVKRIVQPIPTINGGSYGDALFVSNKLLDSREIFISNLKYYFLNNVVFDLTVHYKKKLKVFLKKMINKS